MDKAILKKHKIYLFLLVLALTISGCSSNQSNPPGLFNSSYIISGTITDNSTDLPIQSAVINLSSNITTTDGNGYYSLTNITAGIYSISVQADNYYSSQESNIEIYANHIWNKALTPIQEGKLLTGQVNIINTSQDYSVNQLSISNNSPDTDYSTANIPNHRENEILVKYRDNYESNTIQQNNNLIKLGTSKSLKNKGIIAHYQLPADKNIDAILLEYRLSPEVEWAQPNYIYHTTSIPNDPYYSQQWGNHRVNLEGARDYFTGSNSVTVAVLDTGIIPDHPDLIDRIITGADFVGDPTDGLDYNMTDGDPTDETEGLSHGSHVAGIIGSSTDNNKGIAGVYGQVDILPVRVINSSGNGNTLDLREGIEYAVKKGVDIINLSLAGSGNDQLLHEIIQEAVAQGIVVVAAAGNSGGSVKYPAAFPEVIAVGSINSDNQLSDFSSYGSEMELVAPGENIISTSGYMDDGSFDYGYYNMSGTSMATPYVSGIAALLKASGRTDIRNILRTTAVDLGDKGPDEIYGYGLVDAYAALRGAALPLPDVFAASIKGTEITTESLPGVWNNESYYITDIDPGEYYLVAIRDLNNNGKVDSGDYFGKSTETIYIEENTTTNKDIDLYYVDDNSPYHGWKLLKE